MFTSTILVSLALTSFVVGQSSNPALDIEAIQAHFSAAGLVPSLLTSFHPSMVLDLSYAGVGKVAPGQRLTRSQVGPTPTLTVTPANSTVATSGNYTIAMVDAGPVGASQAAGQTRHWLVNSATISGSTVANSSAVAITAYAGPAPPAGEGPHRYAILLYAQPSTFRAPAAFSRPVGVSVFSLASYIKDSGLGALVAGTYITVEQGTATASLSPTSAVVTSTLALSKTSTKSASPSSTQKPQTGGAVGLFKVPGTLLVTLGTILTFTLF